MGEYRFVLEPYSGPASRFPCVQCGKKGRYTRYIDTESGHRLPMEFGRCDREHQCGYHHHPYSGHYQPNTNAPNSPNYYPTLRHEAIKETDKKTGRHIIIPQEIVQKTLAKHDENNFIRHLIQRFGLAKTNDLIQQFKIGSSRYWPGATVFWIINQVQEPVGGQVVLFDQTGHTAKDSSGKRCTTWIHTALRHSFLELHKEIPGWLTEYAGYAGKFPCLFGEHQLKHASPDHPVAIVEAPKTAIICSGYFPEFLWMAIGSLSYLNESRTQSLMGRRGTLFPDNGAFRIWDQKRRRIPALSRFTISDILERDGTLTGMDLADAI